MNNKIILMFEINKQTLKRVDTCKIAENSSNFVYANFNFSEEWEGLEKTVKCKYGVEVPYECKIEDDKCQIPNDVIRSSGFLMTIIGKNEDLEIVATTDDCFINVRQNFSNQETLGETVRKVESETLNVEKNGHELKIEIPNQYGMKFSLDQATGILRLLGRNDEVLSEVDFPNEKIIERVYYDETTDNLVIKFINADAVEIPIGKLINLESVSSDIIPDENETHNMGSKRRQWKNIYGTEVHASKFRLMSGIDVESDTPIYETFAKIEDNSLKIYYNGVSVAQFGLSGINLKNIDDVKIFQQDGNGNVFVSYSSGEKAFVASKDGSVKIISQNGVEVLKATNNTLKIRNPEDGKILLDFDNAKGGMNSGNDQLDLVHASRINIIPFYDWANGEGADSTTPSSYDRMEFGGDEIVRVTEEGDTAVAVIMAYKRANSEGEVVPFAITKDGEAYYQGSELATQKEIGDIASILDMLNGVDTL